MPQGPGKYDPECATIQLTTMATTVVLVIVGGDRGNGFSVVSQDPDCNKKLPAMLRNMADQIEGVVS